MATSIPLKDKKSPAVPTKILILICVVVTISAIRPTGHGTLESFLNNQFKSLTQINYSIDHHLNTSRCEYPIVYNKPPKTGSTFIQQSIDSWARSHNRSSYSCSGWPHTAAVRLPECIPRSAQNCGIYNGHLLIDESIKPFLQDRFPKFRRVTSTRYGPHRIISLFLQVYAYKNIHKIVDKSAFFLKLKNYLLHNYNPYEIVSWYLDKPITRRYCPMEVEELQEIWNAVSRFDIVIDLNLFNQSNTILNHSGLFTFPEKMRPLNERGTGTLSIPTDIKAILRNVSCYENRIHEALLWRMASIYESATTSRCLRHGRPESTTSCLNIAETQYLRSSWMI